MFNDNDNENGVVLSMRRYKKCNVAICFPQVIRIKKSYLNIAANKIRAFKDESISFQKKVVYFVSGL
jgi:hypothetical protein